MSLKYSQPNAQKKIKRVAIYNRVSTQRQQQNDLSLPDQSQKNREYCANHGYEVYDEVFEYGSASTDEHRPKFQDLVSQALTKPAPFDAIIVHSLSRFYRNHIEQEYIRRRLKKNGVELISITQDFGDDDMGVLTRQILGIVDEMQSKETSKHVRRTMIANAKAGWWTAAHAPFGYKIKVIEVVGTRKRRKLEECPTDGATVRLIFKLCLEGDGTSGPMGIKKITYYLNERGYKFKNRPYYTSHVERVLKNEGYTGKYWYNRSDTREKVQRPRSEWVAIDVPGLITPEDFQRVQVMLHERAPKTTPPRILASQVLLTGIAICAVCGGRMKISNGTGNNGVIHRYYRCANRAQKGICGQGVRNTIREDRLDAVAIEAVISSIMTADRVQSVINAVCQQRQANREKNTKTLERLRHNLAQLKRQANNLLGAIADGVIGDNDLFREKLDGTIAQRDHVQRLITIEEQQMKDEMQPISEMDAEVAAQRLRTRLERAPKEIQKRLLRALIGEVVVSADEIVIRGPEPALAETADAARWSEDFQLSAVHTSDREWRTRKDSNL